MQQLLQAPRRPAAGANIGAILRSAAFALLMLSLAGLTAWPERQIQELTLSVGSPNVAPQTFLYELAHRDGLRFLGWDRPEQLFFREISPPPGCECSWEIVYRDARVRTLVPAVRERWDPLYPPDTNSF